MRESKSEQLMGKKLQPEVLAHKVIPNVTKELAETLDLKPHQKSIGLITSTVDDVLFIAIDEATKVADVEVVYCECVYGGYELEVTTLAGEAIGIIAGPNPEEVKSGLEACAYHIENGAHYTYSDNKGESIWLAHVISRSGTFLSTSNGIEPGTAMAYCAAPSLESLFAVDAALKAADVEAPVTWLPPLATTNFGGALFTGSQSACEAAAEAFKQACISIANDPLQAFK